MAKISAKLDELTGKKETDQHVVEQFAFLQKMARAKSEVFENELKLMLASSASDSALEIVGSKAFEYRHGQHVNISYGCDDAIMGVVDEFFKGKKGVKEGFRALVKQGLSGIIGDTTIGEVEDSMFFVYPENYSIVRVDVKAYKYTFSTKDIVAKDVENVFVYTMSKSIVDHTKVGVDYLMHSVVDMMRTDPDEDPDLSEVLTFIKELISCWQLLDTVCSKPSMVLASAMSPVEEPVYMNDDARKLKAAYDVQNRKLTADAILDTASAYEGA